MQIRAMRVDDISFGMRLKAQNGWNQLESDWRRQLELEPEGCFVAQASTGREPGEMATLVGTACTCVFGDIAWINLVLVDQQERGQGIGTALLQHVLHYLDIRGIPTIRLDATPMGQPVYEKLGFRGDFTLSRYEGILPHLAEHERALQAEPLTPADLPAVLALDEAVTRTAREKLLRHLCTAHLDSMRKFAPGGRMEGFCFARPGAHAWQIGPVQGTAIAGRALLLDAAQRFAGQRVFLDVPSAHADAVRCVQSLGLKVQRSFLRMTRGARVQEDLQSCWSSFGPEKG